MQRNDNCLTFNSPIGKISLINTGDYITNIIVDSDKEINVSDNKLLIMVRDQLIEYFQGVRTTFDFPYKTNATSFQNRVLNELIKIPYGSTASYKDIACQISAFKAFRAVGGACNKNKLPIVIPCHRVVGSKNNMVGYASGLWRKEALLALEKRQEYHLTLSDNTEKIFSFGVSSPLGFYYEDSRAEEVELLLGSAELEIEGRIIKLKEKDRLLIKPKEKHRVNFTSWDCVWFCKYL